jgi:hypothetical protein
MNNEQERSVNIKVKSPPPPPLEVLFTGRGEVTFFIISIGGVENYIKVPSIYI